MPKTELWMAPPMPWPVPKPGFPFSGKRTAIQDLPRRHSGFFSFPFSLFLIYQQDPPAPLWCRTETHPFLCSIPITSRMDYCNTSLTVSLVDSSTYNHSAKAIFLKHGDAINSLYWNIVFGSCNELSSGPPKKRGIQVPEPVNVTIYGKGFFADVIKLKVARWDHPELPRLTLNPMASVLIRDRQDTDTEEKARTANSCLHTYRMAFSNF